MPTTGQSQLPDLSSVVDQYFDLAEKVLANQRELAQQWASATLKVTEAVTEQAQRAQSVTAHTANGTEAVVDNAAETARVASEKAGLHPSRRPRRREQLTSRTDRRPPGWHTTGGAVAVPAHTARRRDPGLDPVWFHRSRRLWLPRIERAAPASSARGASIR